MANVEPEKLAEAYRKMTNHAERGDWVALSLVRLMRNNSGAELFLRKIMEIWRNETNELIFGLDRDRPDPGLLKAVGYRVGHTGQSSETRKFIISFLLSAEVLPPIKDKGYMAEWGQPCSQTRYNKLVRVLCRLNDDLPEHDPKYFRAYEEREEDLHFARRAWTYLEGRKRGGENL